MASFVWMKVLESAPERYDRGVQMLSGGRIDEVYTRIAETAAAPGKRVLDIGCGTGAVSLACAARGAKVTGIDIDAGMLEVARAKPGAGDVDFVELGAAEIEDRFPLESFDAVVSCLAFSELSPDEQRYALKTAFSRLVPGGIIVIADETEPDGALARLGYHLARGPRTALTYLFTQTTTRAVRGLGKAMRAAGFEDVHEESRWRGTFVIATGRKAA